MTWKATSAPLHLSVDPWWDLIACTAYGVCDDGLGPRQRHAVADDAVDLITDAEGIVVGFGTDYDIDVDLLDADVIWDGPRFEVPTLGLAGATIGEILTAVRGRYGDRGSTVDAKHFHAGINSEGAEAAQHFAHALEAGQMKAHFALGYTLVELGRAREAYSHLRRYTELVPLNSWGWCWLGQACAAVGDVAEARRCYEEAIRLEQELDSFETAADELLADLERDQAA